MESGNELENFLVVKDGIMKDGLMINWEKFKDWKTPFIILVSTVIDVVVNAFSSTFLFFL